MRIKSIFYTFFLFATTLLLLALFLEFTIRILFPIYNPNHHVVFRMSEVGIPLLDHRESEKRQWKNTGDFDVQIYSNREGLRSQKSLSQISSDTVLFVGDSYSFGWGVSEQDRYSNILSTITDIDTFNISVPTDLNGYAKQLEYAKTNGAPVDRVVISVCMENDIKIYAKTQTTGNTGSLINSVGQRKQDTNSRATPKSDINVLKSTLSFLTRYKSTLADNIAIYNLVTDFVHSHFNLKRLAMESNLIRPNIIRTQVPPSIEAVNSTVKRLEQIINEYHIDALILIIPSRYNWIKNFNQNDHRKVHKLFVQLSDRAGLSYVDMRPIFQTHGKPLEMYFTHDPHWNAAGHRHAAYALIHRVYKDKHEWLKSSQD